MYEWFNEGVSINSKEIRAYINITRHKQNLINVISYANQV